MTIQSLQHDKLDSFARWTIEKVDGGILELIAGLAEAAFNLGIDLTLIAPFIAAPIGLAAIGAAVVGFTILTACYFLFNRYRKRAGIA